VRSALPRARPGVALEAVTAEPQRRRPRGRGAKPVSRLSSFTEKDAAHFFGREEEVRRSGSVCREQIACRHWPSGAGKTSFVRAGVIPAAPEDGAVCGSRRETGHLPRLCGRLCRSCRTIQKRCSGWWGGDG